MFILEFLANNILLRKLKSSDNICTSMHFEGYIL